MNSSKKLLVGAALGVFGAAALSGCSPASGTAALINGVAIPDSRVTAFSEGCSAVLQDTQLAQSPNELRSQMVTWAVLDEMSRQKAAQMDDPPTDTQLRDYVEQAGLNILLTDDRCAEAARGVARHDLIALGLGVNTEPYFGGYTVELNPRYGSWDATNLDVSGSGSLSEIANS